MLLLACAPQLNFGGKPGDKQVLEGLPEWLAMLVSAVTSTGVWPADEAPNHILINDFTAGAGLTPHTDGPLYAPRVATLSLGSDVVLNLHRPHEEDVLHSLLLRRGSLNVISGAAYVHAVGFEPTSPLIRAHTALLTTPRLQ